MILQVSHRPSLQKFHDTELIIGDESVTQTTKHLASKLMLQCYNPVKPGSLVRARTRMEPILDEGVSKLQLSQNDCSMSSRGIFQQ